MSATTDSLLEDMRDARRRTLAAVADLTDDQLTVSKFDIVNPFRWELGHVAFFWDEAVRVYLDGRPHLLEGAARIYDSFKVDHDNRWDLPLPSRAGTLDYMRRVAEDLERRAEDRGIDGSSAYCYRLSTLHEDMHGEAFCTMRQALGYGAPEFMSSECEPSESAAGLPGDVSVPGGTFALGADPDTRHFVFDNEKWSHPVEVERFRIARAPVTNVEFLEFVSDGGYDREDLWSHQGWVWRCKRAVGAPENWVRSTSGWECVRFGAVVELRPHHPVMHVGYHEAVAFCNWAGRRLPTEPEWDMAASFDPATGTKRRYPWGDSLPGPDELPDFANLDARLHTTIDVAACPRGDSPVGCRQMVGNIWEWTDSPFYPFPGYVVDLPYREYSAPWFGYRKVLKGGAFVTRGRLAHNTYRNFFLPDRRDIFAGFRTCAR